MYAFCLPKLSWNLLLHQIILAFFIYGRFIKILLWSELRKKLLEIHKYFKIVTCNRIKLHHIVVSQWWFYGQLAKICILLIFNRFSAHLRNVVILTRILCAEQEQQTQNYLYLQWNNTKSQMNRRESLWVICMKMHAKHTAAFFMFIWLKISVLSFNIIQKYWYPKLSFIRSSECLKFWAQYQKQQATSRITRKCEPALRQ